MIIGKVLTPSEPIKLGRRVGKFKVSIEYIMGGASDLDLLFHKVYVIRADNDFAHNWVEYTAISPHFDELGEGEAAPDYIPTVTKTPIKVSLHWERAKSGGYDYNNSKDGPPIC